MTLDAFLFALGGDVVVKTDLPPRALSIVEVIASGRVYLERQHDVVREITEENSG